MVSARMKPYTCGSRSMWRLMQKMSMPITPWLPMAHS